jgi:hypothetical protein
LLADDVSIEVMYNVWPLLVASTMPTGVECSSTVADELAFAGDGGDAVLVVAFEPPPHAAARRPAVARIAPITIARRRGLRIGTPSTKPVGHP